MTNTQSSNKIHFQLLRATLLCLLPFLTQAQFTPGVPTFDSTGYVEYIPGNLPVVISVPHGGYLEPDDIPDRDCDTYTCVRDLFTQELGRSIGDAFYEETGCYPHIIINLLHRKKFDANREIIEAADGNLTVEQAWYGYHALIDSAKTQIVEDYGRGLFLDLHGHGHTIQRIELGYRLSKSELQLSDSELNSNDYIEKSSIQTLVGDNLLALSHSELLRGDSSFGTLLDNVDVPAVPSAPDPFPEDNESYFSGGYNTGRHGSSNGGNIDGIQIECHQDIRFDTDLREMFADSLALVINDFFHIHYNDQYENNYCNLLTDVPTNTILEDLKIFPNPVIDFLYIENVVDGIVVVIYNYLGQKLITRSWRGTPIDLSFLKSGYYIIQLKKEAVTLSTKGFIKK